MLRESFFFKEKKIVYSMERLAVRAVNESKAGIGKIRSYLKKILEREKNSIFNGEIGGKSVNESNAGIGKIRMEHRKIINFKHIRKTIPLVTGFKMYISG